MKEITIIIFYLGFFGLIAFAVYWTKSASPLWALLLFPTISWKSDNNEEDKQDEE